MSTYSAGYTAIAPKYVTSLVLHLQLKLLVCSCLPKITLQGRRYRGGRGGSSPPTFIGGGAEPLRQISVVTSYLAHKSKYLVWCGLASRLGATLFWLHGSPSRA